MIVTKITTAGKTRTTYEGWSGSVLQCLVCCGLSRGGRGEDTSFI